MKGLPFLEGFVRKERDQAKAKAKADAEKPTSPAP